MLEKASLRKRDYAVLGYKGVGGENTLNRRITVCRFLTFSKFLPVFMPDWDKFCYTPEPEDDATMGLNN
jgi:hypothetical protein